MSIEKLMNRTNESTILGIEEKGEAFLLLFGCPLFFFYSMGNHNLHIPPIRLYSPKKI
jgi:hypothetical protein